MKYLIIICTLPLYAAEIKKVDSLKNLTQLAKKTPRKKTIFLSYDDLNQISDFSTVSKDSNASYPLTVTVPNPLSVIPNSTNDELTEGPSSEASSQHSSQTLEGDDLGIVISDAVVKKTKRCFLLSLIGQICCCGCCKKQ